jgi:NADH:ubiquinone oxidoreductase subunit 2 (subunit N)
MIASVAVGRLLELAWVALVASVVLAVAYSTCVLGLTRASEHRRAGHAAEATAYAALGIAGAAVVAAGVAGALWVIIAK